MGERRLDRQETDFMREYVQEGVDRGETAEQIKARRRELAELFGCSQHQVSGAVAWKNKGQEKLVLEPLEITESQDAPEAQPVPPPVLPAAMPESQPPNSSPVPLETTTPALTDETTTDPETSQEQPALDVQVHPKSGAWADFEKSEIKDRWRQLEAEFIDKHIDPDPAVRARMKILCTPGIKCYKEVDRLLSLGFRPENITAVERVKGAWDEFETNCRVKGIRPIYGDLKTLLPKTSTRYDIACVDFLGPMCGSYSEILQQLPLADRAILAVNMMGKRERSEVQETMNFYQDIMDGSIDEYRRQVRTEATEQVQAQGLEHIFGMVDVEVEDMARQRPPSDRHVSEVRDASLHWLLARVGTGRPDNWMYADRLNRLPLHLLAEAVSETEDVPRHQLIKKTVDEYLKHFAQMLELRMVRGARYSNLNRAQQPSSTRNAIFSALFGVRFLSDLKQYRYQSGVSKTHSPFITDLALSEKPTDIYKRIRHLAHFGLQFVETEAAFFERNKDGLMESIKGDSPVPGMGLDIFNQIPIVTLSTKVPGIITGSDRVVINDGRKVVGGIQLSNMVSDTEAVSTLGLARYPLHSTDRDRRVDSVEREIITL